MTIEPTVAVRPLLRILANGSRQGKTGKWLKFTLIATPEFDSATPISGKDGAFALENWPLEMATRLRQGQPPFSEKASIGLFARLISPVKVPPVAEPAWRRIPLQSASPNAFDKPERWQIINRLWQESLATAGSDDWKALALDIERSIGGKKHQAELTEKYAGNPDFDAGGAIVAEPPAADQTITVKGVVPVRQSDFALEEQGERAARILNKQMRGVFAVDDESYELDEETVEEQFSAATADTDGERKLTFAANRTISEAIGQSQGAAPVVTRPKAASVVPVPGDVVVQPQAPGEANVKTTDRSLRRATHRYATWLQRRSQYKAELDDQGKVKRPDISKLIENPDSRTDQLRGVYFALQGDPVLSRLFCLAFDFEVEESVFRAEVGDGRVHLALAQPPSPRRAAVATAARLHDKGFWPVSTFEAMVVTRMKDGREVTEILDLPQFAEQHDGLWKLGVTTKARDAAGKDVEVPRYEIVSLDIRRSVDGKTTGRDRGEQHHTGGFTILDRGRGDQIARDLALSSAQAGRLDKPEDVIVLHAEELTIGRRVDVAVAAAGAAAPTLKWRSLMHRYVDFGFRTAENAAEAILNQMFPGKAQKGVLEEVSFQVAARFMPAGGNGYEAVAEEAIYTWDGSPAGVLTDSGARNKRLLSHLPFDRKLDLPGKEMAIAGMLPAPLRFGYPYLFRFRSAFLGGGSPDSASVDTAANTGDFDMAPAGRKQIARPRRFLRHESIGAPVLMLPHHLALRRYDRMGYEQADQAIIRSWNDAASQFDDEIETGIAGDYVAGPLRAQPAETMRILVAPEVGLDLVVRHGEMDGGKAAEVRRGGLTDVSYVPKPSLLAPESSSATPRASGFPVAITSVRDTLNAEGAIYRRKVAAVADAAESGIPVFEPGGLNAEPTGSVGYLPDPAIDHFSVRARIRGSDRYLDGDIQVKTYAGRNYPHALPLAVVVTKSTNDAKTVRPRHPEAIGDIAQLAGVFWMSSDGRLSASKPARGTRVQRLNVQLYPGEDFDLEIACLPSPELLARTFAAPEAIALQLKLAGQDGLAFDRLKDLCGDKIATACKAVVGEQSLTGVGGAEVPDATTLGAVAADILNAMRSRWPIEEIAAVTTLRVCHAINKPASPASFHDVGALASFRRPDQMNCGDVINPVLANEDDATGLFLQGRIEIDLSLADGFQLVAETVGTDGAALDARQRGRSMISRRTGRWPTLTRPTGGQAYVAAADVVGFRVAEDGSVTLPRNKVVLLGVTNLPTTGAIGDIVTLAKDSTGTVCKVPAGGPFFSKPDRPAGAPVFQEAEGRMTAIELAPLFAAASAAAPITQQIAMQRNAQDVTRRTRTLKTERPHIFRDTLARELSLQLVSTSRHAAAFETAPTYVDGKEHLLYRRQPLKRGDQAVAGSEIAKVWMNSTRRPATPDLLRPEPSFVITRSSAVSAAGVRSHFFTRRALTRLYLARGWFSSGEGERVGLVLWPPRYASLIGKYVDKDEIRYGDRDINLHDFADADLGPGGAFVTRWGGDPIREDKTPQSGNFIPPEAFGDLDRKLQGPHRPDFVEVASMPVRRENGVKDTAESGNAAAAYDYLPVSLLTYEPCFDLDREEWYVDVDLKPIRASEPFVRFGVVRYQEHSIRDDLKVSQPATVMMQLLPERRVEITDSKVPISEDRSVSIKVQGLGSNAIKELDPGFILGTDAEKQMLRANFASLHRPKIKLSLFHEAMDGDGTLLRTPIGADELRFQKDDLISPRPDPVTLESEVQFELPEPKLENATLVWSTAFNIQREVLDGLGRGRIVAYLEEVDRRMPATYRSEPVLPKTMFSADTFVESGPRFSARVPFIETN